MKIINYKIKSFFSYAKKHKIKSIIIILVIVVGISIPFIIKDSYALSVTGSTSGYYNVNKTGTSAKLSHAAILNYTTSTSDTAVTLTATSLQMKVVKISYTASSDPRFRYKIGNPLPSSWSSTVTTTKKKRSAGSVDTIWSGSSAKSYARGCGSTTGYFYAYLEYNGDGRSNSSNGSSMNYNSSATASVSVPALPRYTVSYNANGGTGAPANNSGTNGCSTSDGKVYGKTFTLSSVQPTRTGYTFAGWNTNSTGTGTNYAAGATYTGNAALALYAKWNGSSYTLKINPNSGSIDGNEEEQTLSPNLVLGGTNWNNVSTYVPTREGYTFLGYYSEPEDGDLVYDASGLAVKGAYWDANGAGAKYLNMSDLTAYAKWKKNTETVTFDADGGTTSESTREITRGSAYQTLPTVEKEKYTFENWQYVPKGYQQVDYIESTGTQYIDTGYKPNADTGVLATYQFSEVSTLQQRVYGVHGDDADTDSVSYAHYINGSGGMSYAYKDGTGNWIVTGTTAATTKMTFKENVDPRYISMNGGTNTPIQGIITRTSKYNLMIMTGVEPDGAINQYGKLKLYEFNIYENGELIRHYVPCYRTSDNEIGLYEVKEGKFYKNAGSGTFTKGNDIQIETTTTIVEGDHKLYAHYSVPNTSYEVDFDSNGGSGEMEEQIMEYDKSENLKENAFTKEGYNFMGWNTSDKAQGKWYREISGVNNIANKASGERKKTLYAQWAKKSYAKIYKQNTELDKDTYGNYIIKIKK